MGKRGDAIRRCLL